MAHYSVATTKDNLSSLIDKALAGEEVVITRHGKPTVELRIVGSAIAPKNINAEWSKRLQTLRESLPTMTTTFMDLKRMDEDEGAL